MANVIFLVEDYPAEGQCNPADLELLPIHYSLVLSRREAVATSTRAPASVTGLPPMFVDDQRTTGEDESVKVVEE